MKIELPNKTNASERTNIDSKSVVVIGANGAGKTRFGSEIERTHLRKTHRISAQKSLSMPEQVSPTSMKNAENDFRYGHTRGNFNNIITSRWSSKPNTFLLNDYGKLMVLLHTEEYEESIKFKYSYSPGQGDDKPVTKLDRIKNIWEKVLPHRKIKINAGNIETYPTNFPDTKYNAAEMSDGERVVFYLIGEVVSVSENSILVIDEPEMHLHKSIIKPLWDRIEHERPDCTFIYLTHDIDFALSRLNSTKIWVKGYDGVSWDYEILEENDKIPEQLYLEILGSRKPVLFIEGDDSSIDYKLFQLTFPDHNVKPIGGCTKVFETTKAFNEQKSFHHIESFGLIDRDRRSDEDIRKIEKRNIWIADVAEAENFLLLEEVIFIVANKMNKDAKGVFESVKINVIDFFSSQIEFQSAQHTLASIETNLGKATNFKSIKNYSDLETSLNDYWANLDIANTFNIIKTKFETLVSNQDYVGILKVFNNKGLIPNSKVASLCDLKSSNNAYLNFILAILKEKSKSSEIIQEAITRNVRMD